MYVSGMPASCTGSYPSDRCYRANMHNILGSDSVFVNKWMAQITLGLLCNQSYYGGIPIAYPCAADVNDATKVLGRDGES